MAEGSIAPKERVNITYKPAIGDAQEEKELPLKMLMLGDYTLRPDDTEVERRRKVSIDKDNFNDVMRAHNLSLTFNVPNRLSEEEEGDLRVGLTFETIRDFEPEQIVRKVPELNTLLELREALNALRGPLGNTPAFRRRIQELLEDPEARQKLLDELKMGEES